MDAKKKCVEKALEMISDGMVIGLGGGSTVALLVQELENHNRKVQAVSPSQATMDLCVQYHIPLLPLEMTEELDLAFDGCDEVDAGFHVLKSGGGIHTREKIVAAMAKKYIILTDEKKWMEKLEFSHPVALEVIRPARQLVRKRLEEMGAKVAERRSDEKMGVVISDDGNYLMDACFSEVDDMEGLSDKLDQIPGLVGHSLFCGFVTGVILAKANGEAQVIEK